MISESFFWFRNPSVLCQDVRWALQERLHSGRPVAQQALLVDHIEELLARPLAFDLVLPSLPSDPQLLSSVYDRLQHARLTGRWDVAASAGSGRLTEHIRRELRRVAPGARQRKGSKPEQ